MMSLTRPNNQSLLRLSLRVEPQSKQSPSSRRELGVSGEGRTAPHPVQRNSQDQSELIPSMVTESQGTPPNSHKFCSL